MNTLPASALSPPRGSTTGPRCLALCGLLFALATAGFSASQAWASPPPLPWTAGTNLRTVELPTAPSHPPGFARLGPDQTGVRFTNVLQGDLSLTNAVAHNGSGLALGDVNGDGWTDIYLCALDGPNRLYLNQGGWKFSEADPGAAACEGQLSTGAALVDTDGDGDLDLLVNGIAAGTRLFANDGNGRFTEVSDSGLSRTASSTSLALADIDADGDLDLYCTHYIDVMHLADPTTRFALARDANGWKIARVNGEPVTKPYWKDRFEVLADGSVRELPEVHGLYRNLGSNRFKAIQHEPGVFRDSSGQPVPPFRDWGLSVMFRDLNGDGSPDLYICNDNASPDRVWLNDGRGSFRAAGPFMFRHTSRSSMALDFADVNRDGHDDLLVLDMLARSPARRLMQLVRDFPDRATHERVDTVPRYNRNTLFLAHGDGTFAETALMAGLAATDWSWCPMFLDVDLDGYEDLLISNGFEFDVMDQDSSDQVRRAKLTFDQRKRIRQFHPSWLTENLAYRNLGNGTFEDRSAGWGFNATGVSWGMAAGDLDNDGDLDLVVNNQNAAAGVYRNESPAPRVAVRLKGQAPNTRAIGARVRLLGGPVSQSQEMMAGGRYMGSDDPVRVFAAGTNPAPSLQLEVTWPGGARTTQPLKPNILCEAVQPEAKDAPVSAKSAPEPAWFKDASDLLSHQHTEADFDDWSRQPLLPKRLSRLGPGLAWLDLNGDGWEGLAIAGGRGSRLQLLLNQSGKGFARLSAGPESPADGGAIVSLAAETGNTALMVATGDSAGIQTNGALTLYALRREPGKTLPDPVNLNLGAMVPGPLALGDVDGDGDLDAFVGGRYLPGKYPAPAPSFIVLNQDGNLKVSPSLSAGLAALGLVNGAAFCDLDADGDLDLAVAIEWGPVRVFHNTGGQFAEMTQAWGFEERRGLWTGICAGDFDGDGRLDLAVGNWGRNSIYELYRPAQLGLFYGDRNRDGILEVLEAWKEGETWRPIRERTWLQRGFPELEQQFPTHKAFGLASVPEILGPAASQFQLLSVAHLESSVFLNRSNRFVCVPLPGEAQVSPAFSVNAGDFDGDGIDDLFLSQNFFGSASLFSREDAGRGLWLRGRGDGTFTPAETGVVVYGEQRGAALADFNRDGRVDVAIGQNNGPTRLFLNQRGKPGLRVRLQGPARNSHGIGAVLRVLYTDGQKGPTRAVQAGSGYCSQDSAVQVLGCGRPVAAVEVRWPGGRTQVVAVKGETEELVVRY